MEARGWRPDVDDSPAGLLARSRNLNRSTPRGTNWLYARLAKTAVPVSVAEVNRQTEEEPDAEPLPGRSRKAAHDEETARRRQDAHGPNQWNLERPLAIRVLVT